MWNQEKIVKEAKEKFPVGVRVRLDAELNGDDYSRLKAGDEGVVRFVDDMGTVHVNWDCGSGLGLIYGEDCFHIIP